MGGGSDIAIESAGILLPSGNLEKLPELFDISRATIRTIRQNLTWALFYNLVSIPVAALGVLHPSICATAMSASSIGVLMHSLRLKDSDKKERRFPWKKKVLTTYVRGIYCRQCPEWIVDDLLHTRGVLDAAVSFWRAELTVRYDPQIVTEAELRRVLSDCGYPACEKRRAGVEPAAQRAQKCPRPQAGGVRGTPFCA